MKNKINLMLVFFLFTSAGLTDKNRSNVEASDHSQNGGSGYQITKYTLSSGGGVITGGNYHLTSSIGQLDAGHKATGGNYEFNGGFLSENTDLIFKNGFE